MSLGTITWMRWVAFVAAVGPAATLLMGCTNGHEPPSDRTSAPHAPPALELDGSKDCGRLYGERGRVFDPETRWTYFTDIVQEFTAKPDGSATVAFRLSARRYEIPRGADPAFSKAAEASWRDGKAVHVAIEENKSKNEKGPGGVGTTGELPKVYWIDANQQHPSYHGCGKARGRL